MNMVLLLFSFPIVVVFVFILQVFTVTSADDVALADNNNDFKMIPIDSDIDYQNIVVIRIVPKCTWGSQADVMTVPNTMFTIFPSNEGDGVTYCNSSLSTNAVRRK